jgi:hypothetical protein
LPHFAPLFYLIVDNFQYLAEKRHKKTPGLQGIWGFPNGSGGVSGVLLLYAAFCRFLLLFAGFCLFLRLLAGFCGY